MLPLSSLVMFHMKNTRTNHLKATKAVKSWQKESKEETNYDVNKIGSDIGLRKYDIVGGS